MIPSFKDQGLVIDVERVRAETPGCQNVLHFNNAGASLPPMPVLASVMAHLQREAEVGGYEAEAEAEEQIEHTYGAIARMLNCDRHEVAFIGNATRAWDMAFYAMAFQEGDRILTCQSEYASNYIAFLQVARRTGAVIEVIPSDDSGQVCLDTLARMLDVRVKLVAITHVPTNGGLVNPAADIGSLTRAANIPFLLDACQSVGQMPIDVEAIGCDMLSATGRKFLRGPRGTGFLYVRQSMLDTLEPPFLDGRAARWKTLDQYEVCPDARRFENWESYVAGRIGLGVAVNYATNIGCAAIRQRITILAEQLRAQLAKIDGIQVCDLGQTRCGIVSFTKTGVSASQLHQHLKRHFANTSISGVEWTRLDMEARGLAEVLRASVHYYNTEDEVEQFCALVAQFPHVA